MSFRASRVALPIGFSIWRSRLVAIAGAGGCGKTDAIATCRVVISRRWKDAVQDLKASLQEIPMSGSNSNGPAITIILEDDDPEIQISSDSFSQGNSVRPPTLHDFIVIDDPLELRLGPTGPSTQRGPDADHPEAHTRRARSDPPTIDLTFSLNKDYEIIHETNKRRKRVHPAADELLSTDSVREVRLTCIICMDTMKEETSTICGHIFCKECILGAIQAQRTCPTCRKKLTSKDIHRIYISGNTS